MQTVVIDLKTDTKFNIPFKSNFKINENIEIVEKGKIIIKGTITRVDNEIIDKKLIINIYVY